MLANLTVNHPNIAVWGIHEQNGIVSPPFYPWVTATMTASIEMKSSESEAPLRGDMVKAIF